MLWDDTGTIFQQNLEDRKKYRYFTTVHIGDTMSTDRVLNKAFKRAVDNLQLKNVVNKINKCWIRDNEEFMRIFLQFYRDLVTYTGTIDNAIIWLNNENVDFNGHKPIDILVENGFVAIYKYVQCYLQKE